VIGDIVYLRLPGLLSMVFVNDLEMAHELLVKRANNTAGRPITYMATELLVLILIISYFGYTNA
jgi:hypothetical protein